MLRAPLVAARLRRLLLGDCHERLRSIAAPNSPPAGRPGPFQSRPPGPSPVPGTGRVKRSTEPWKFSGSRSGLPSTHLPSVDGPTSETPDRGRRLPPHDAWEPRPARLRAPAGSGAVRASRHTQRAEARVEMSLVLLHAEPLPPPGHDARAESLARDGAPERHVRQMVQPRSRLRGASLRASLSVGRRRARIASDRAGSVPRAESGPRGVVPVPVGVAVEQLSRARRRGGPTRVPDVRLAALAVPPGPEPGPRAVAAFVEEGRLAA